MRRAVCRCARASPGTRLATRLAPGREVRPMVLAGATHHTQHPPTDNWPGRRVRGAGARVSTFQRLRRPTRLRSPGLRCGVARVHIANDLWRERVSAGLPGLPTGPRRTVGKRAVAQLLDLWAKVDESSYSAPRAHAGGVHGEKSAEFGFWGWRSRRRGGWAHPPSQPRSLARKVGKHRVADTLATCPEQDDRS